jgi:cytochrome P450
MVDPQLHQVKRSIAGHAFSPKAVTLYVPYTLKVARRCMDSMAADARAGDSININLVTQSAMVSPFDTLVSETKKKRSFLANTV